MNVYLILWESGTIQSGQDFRQSELFLRSQRLGLISNRESGTPTKSRSSDTPVPTEELLLHISGMWCTSCAWLIEHALESLPGVAQAEASFASDLVKVNYRPQELPPERIVDRVCSIGYKAQRYASDSETADREHRDLLIRTGLAAFLWINVMSLSLVVYAGYFEQISDSVRRGLPFVLMALASPVVFYCAQPVLVLAWRGLLNRTIRMEFLLAVGVFAAYGYSVVQAFRGDIHLYFDTASIIVTLVLAGKLIEHGAKDKVSRWVTTLHRIMPNKVRLLSNGIERFVSVEALNPGQAFRVKVGEHIPADGIVSDGESHTDESLLTGESSPVRKTPGSSVVAGSINLDGVLMVEATKSATDSTLSQIIVQVERALASRCDLERAVDRVSRVFVPSVVLVALLTFAFAWSWGGLSLGQALMRGIAVLVIACPCALGLATPLAITAAMGSASRRGILVRDSRVLEAVRKIDTVVLDKTGTLTEGEFAFVGWVPLEVSILQLAAAGSTDRTFCGGYATAGSQEAFELLASLEQRSEHPLGKAVTEFARAQGTRTLEASDVEIHKGRGISGTVKNRIVFVGNRQFMREVGISIDEVAHRAALNSEREGKTVAFMGWDGILQGLAVFGDRIRPDAISLVNELKCRGVDVLLASGDSETTTESTATGAGIASFEAEVSPDGKAEFVKRLQSEGKIVAMVGDGINDAPALAQADLGIAMGSGTDIAMRAASVVLINPFLLKIPEVFDLSQRAIRVVHQNLFWAFFYNGIGISLAVVGILNPILAACAMLVSSVFVVGNSIRLSRPDPSFSTC